MTESPLSLFGEAPGNLRIEHDDSPSRIRIGGINPIIGHCFILLRSVHKAKSAACNQLSPKEKGYRLLAITGEIVDTRMPAIFFFGSLTLLNLIVSTLLT